MRRIGGLLLALLLGLAVGLPVALATFMDSERTVMVGPHEASVRPTFNGYATIDFGPLLPLVRVPSDGLANIGVEVRLGEAEVDDLEELLQQNAVIASQPQGEIAVVRGAVADMARVSIARGLGVALIFAVVAVLAWRAIGANRRKRIVHDLTAPTRQQLFIGVVTVVVVVLGLVLITVPKSDDVEPETEWVAARKVFPELPANPILDQLQISDGSVTRGSRALVEGALYLYEDSVSFYGDLAEAASKTEVRTPRDGQTTALVVSDRHDNIGMDPVARKIADQAEASTLISLGDDTSQGDSWEQFSINSLADEFAEFNKVAVAGNHDSETTIKQLKQADFTVLDGEVERIGPIGFIGQSDPRGTTIAGYTESATKRSDLASRQDEALTATACRADRTGSRAPVAAVHSWASAKQLATSGCVDLVLTGHLHYQVGPRAIRSEGDHPTTRMGIATTGGAVLPIALGSKLRRDAQVTIVTFESGGTPVGLQAVTFLPSGDIRVDDYVELPLPAREARDAEAPDEPEDPEEPAARKN